MHLKKNHDWHLSLLLRSVLWSKERKKIARQERVYEMERATKEKEREKLSWVSGLGAKADFSPGLLVRVRFTWSTMQWASLWPSSVIKTSVSLAAQSALFCHPSQPPGTPWLPPIHFFRPAVRSYVLFAGLFSVCRSFARSLSSPSLPSLCRLRTVFEFVARAINVLLRSRFPLFLVYFGLSPRFVLASHSVSSHVNKSAKFI